MTRKVVAGTGGVNSAANDSLKKLIDNIFQGRESPKIDPEKEKVHLSFEVTVGQYEKIQAWLNEQNVKAISIQRKKYGKNAGPEFHMSWEMGYPYCGAIGGEIKYEFSPTSLGDCLVVKHSVTGEEINVTDFDRW